MIRAWGLRQNALERQDLKSRTYLAHQELDRVTIIIIIIVGPYPEHLTALCHQAIAPVIDDGAEGALT